jgi:hypothetical protein
MKSLILSSSQVFIKPLLCDNTAQKHGKDWSWGLLVILQMYGYFCPIRSSMVTSNFYSQCGFSKSGFLRSWIVVQSIGLRIKTWCLVPILPLKSQVTLGESPQFLYPWFIFMLNGRSFCLEMQWLGSTCRSGHGSRAVGAVWVTGCE